MSDPVNVDDDSLPERKQVSMPAVRLRHASYRNGQKAAVALEAGQIDQPVSVAETLVRLLQRDDVRADLADDRGCPVGVEPLVHADAFVDVVGGYERVRPRFAAGGIGSRLLLQGGENAREDRKSTRLNSSH